MNFLLYSRHGHITGRELGERLGIPHGREMPDERQDYLIRWGTSQRINYIPNERTWNKRAAIERNTNKINSLRVLEDAGINVPKFSGDIRRLDYPVLGRSQEHMGGRDVKLYLQRADLNYIGESDYYLELIPKKYEFRVHVIGNEVVKISQKINTEEGYDPVVWNYNNGFTFRNPQVDHPGIYMALPAINALGLDFGAVDLIIGEDNEAYILEVNTAPGLDEPSLEVYAEKLSQLIDV